MRDVVVIGAGPAGSLTSRKLAERGHDVVLLEEHAAIGRPVHCTGLLGMEAFAEFDLPRDLVLAEAGAATFCGAGGQSVRVGSERTTAAVIERAALDEILAARAEAAGAEIVRGCRADEVEVRADRVIVRSGDGDMRVEARACVLACGASYRFHRSLGLGLPSVMLQSAQLETPFEALPGIEVRFGRHVAPGGFAWAVPFARGGVPYARIGLMSEDRAAGRLDEFLQSLCRRMGVATEGLPRPRVKVLPLGPVRKTCSDRVVAVGDAAGLVKPTTGGGIYYGLLSGSLAADVLDDGLRRDRLGEVHLQRYEELWRRRLGAEIRVGLAFRRIAARLPDESIDALIDLARVDGVVPLLQQTASFNWHRKAAVALLAHPAFRRIVLRSWVRSASSI